MARAVASSRDGAEAARGVGGTGRRCRLRSDRPWRRKARSKGGFTRQCAGGGVRHHAAIAGELKGLAEPAIVLTPPETPTEQDDGLVTASEVAHDVKLDADWVVLSACNTAAADGAPRAEGLSGLAKAFFYAGARSLLVSHWPVECQSGVRWPYLRDQDAGRAIPVRIESVARDPADAAGDVWLHRLSVPDAGTGAWRALCKPVRTRPWRAFRLRVAGHKTDGTCAILPTSRSPARPANACASDTSPGAISRAHRSGTITRHVSA